MDSTNTLRFGILGCGMVADIHAAAIRSIPEAKLAGAADLIPEAAVRFSEKHSVPSYGSVSEMLSDDSIDVVCICTPSFCHVDNALEALRNGKHVVLEKPMALTTQEADRLIAASRESHRLLTVVSQMRFSEDVRHIRELVQAQAFGKLVLCNLSMRYWRSEEYFRSRSWRGKLATEGGGALMNQGIHGIDLMQYILGEPKVLRGKIDTLHHDVEVEDIALALVEFDNGALGTIQGSTCTWPGFERKLEIHGDKGFVILRENLIEQLVTPDEIIDRRGDSDDVSTSCSQPESIGSEMHARQFRNLIDAIHGRAPLLIDAEEGKKAVRIIESIYSSSRTE